MFTVIAQIIRYDNNCTSDTLTIHFAQYDNAKFCAKKLEACIDVELVKIIEDFQTGEFLYKSED